MAAKKYPPTLLALAPEIRLEIYDYLFIRPRFNICRKPNSLDLCTSNDILIKARKPTIYSSTVPTALLLTCKQIHGEGRAILYSCNTFEFYELRVLLEFLVRIGRISTRHIRALHAIIPWNQEKWAFWPLELLDKLSSDAKN